tara:strand:- start:984 stop:1169 length:186 start_codon:yes stop_codon:yes gene_type:complete
MNELGINAAGNFVGFIGSVAISYTVFTQYTGLGFAVLAWAVLAVAFLFLLGLAHEIANAFK